MKDAVAESTFLTAIAIDKLLAKFQRAHEKLDKFQKGLNDYLEMKRLLIPQFVFLSNDELLDYPTSRSSGCAAAGKLTIPVCTGLARSLDLLSCCAGNRKCG
ncbi:Dynein heavy chain [Phytophthora infestans]|uniref:Dynein heavy chain n=1 Tax=Phytophthora infestans TaxID=4787 RepID=A0A833SH86_PHYIN|nr:Dynein heavy chain [Phytophthora infestans]